MDIITSKDNIKIKYIRSLNLKKFRDEENAFLVEGIKFVEEAINENADIKLLLVSEEALNKSEVKKLIDSIDESKAVVCTAQVFNSAADTVNAQGVLAVINKNTAFQNDIIDNIVVSKQLDKLIKNYIFSYSLINSKIRYYIKKINI